VRGVSLSDNGPVPRIQLSDMGNIAEVHKSGLGIHPLVVIPIQSPVLGTARGRKGELTSPECAHLSFAETSFLLRVCCLGYDIYNSC
jgi:hypothetical protein